MQQFHFRVVKEPDENAPVPVDVAGKVMVDIQDLLKATGEMIMRLELRTQSKFPIDFLDRLTLTVTGSDTKVGANRMEDRELIEYVMSQTCSELDSAGLYTKPESHSANFVEEVAKKKIAGILLRLARDLDGYVLKYGVEGNLRRFVMANDSTLESMEWADISRFDGAVIGILSKTNRTYAAKFSNGIDVIEATFAKDVKGSDECYGAPMIVTGLLRSDENNRLIKIEDMRSCQPFKHIMFHRIFTKDRDVTLFVPAIAFITYDSSKGHWELSNDDLGIHVSKPSWDDAVLAYHEYFMFLWETYVNDQEFEGEEKEISDLLKSMAFP